MKIAVAGNKDTTGILINFLIQDNWPINYLIHLDKNNPDIKNISGYQHFSNWKLPAHLTIYHPQTYSLLSNVDKRNISSFNIDLLLVNGWQRLIPNWLLAQLSIGAFGMHGSMENLPKGRGRSPLNWAIIKGANSFITNLFKYRSGIDDGEILDSFEFQILNSDTGGSLQLKNTFSMLKILQSNRMNLLNNNFDLITQEESAPTYYPKRRPEDGEILWGLSANAIDRLVRAVSNPFPGAFSYIDDYKIEILNGKVISDKKINKYESGEVIGILEGESLLVSTGEGLYWVKDWRADQRISFEKGMKFISSKNYCWDWKKLPMRKNKYCSSYDDIPERYKLYV